MTNPWLDFNDGKPDPPEFLAPVDPEQLAALVDRHPLPPTDARSRDPQEGTDQQ
jgi:hypothetical protein